MGKYTKLRKKVKRFEEKPAYQARIDEFKKSFMGTGEVENANAARLAKEFCDRERAKDVLEAKVKGLNVEIAGLSQLIEYVFEVDGIEKLPMSDGVTVGLKDRLCVKVLDRGKLLRWLKMEYPEVWQKIVSVNSKVLSELCGNLRLSGKKDPPGTDVQIKVTARAYGLGPEKKNGEEGDEE